MVDWDWSDVAFTIYIILKSESLNFVCCNKIDENSTNVGSVIIRRNLSGTFLAIYGGKTQNDKHHY